MEMGSLLHVSCISISGKFGEAKARNLRVTWIIHKKSEETAQPNQNKNGLIQLIVFIFHEARPNIWS